MPGNHNIINIWKYTAFLYTNNEISGREIKESIPFIITSKRISYLGINLPKILYSENYKTLMKEVEDNTNRWKDIPCSWIGRINIVKMTKLTKAIYRFNVIPIKILIAFFTKLEQIMLKFVWRHKRPLIDKTKKNRAVGITLTEFRLYYKTMVIKTV